MNILLVSNRSAYFKSAFGGAETSLRLIAEELANRGHRVWYLTKRFDPQFQLGARSEPISQVEVVSVNFITEDNQSSAIHVGLSWAKKYINEYQSSVFTHQLHQILLRNQIDLAYCSYELNIMQKLIDIQKQGYPVKIVMRMAGNFWYEQCKKKPELIQQYQRAFNTIDLVNFLHPQMRQDVQEKFDELKMTVTFNNYFIGDIGTFSTIGRHSAYIGPNGDDFNLLMAARFSDYQKRQDLLVQSVSLIPANIPVKLTLLGEGVRKNEITELIRSLKLEHQVFVEPFCNQRELWQRLLKTHLLCHACDYEGVSKIMLESMAMGLPVLVSDVTPVNLEIIDGENGFLVENEPKAWADRIMYLYHHQEMLAEVSLRSIIYVEGKYNPKNNILVYEKAFSEIVQTTKNKTNE